MWNISLFQLNYDELEKKAVSDVLDSGWITMGENIIEFESQFGSFLGHDIKCTAVSSGTAAMHLAFLALDIQPGDEIIIPALTFVSDANCVKLMGATPVLADCNSIDDWNVTANSIDAVITEKTKAVVVVHFAGYPCDMKPIVDLCREKGIYLIEDCAHSPGAEIDGKMCGSWGDIGCFSFFTNKNISIGEGGMTSTSNDELAKRLSSLRSHGMTSLTLDRHKGRSISYDVTEPGLNYRMDEIRAALGLVQLKKLSHSNAQRKLLTDRYRQNLLSTNISIPYQGMKLSASSAFHILPALLPDNINRLEVINKLKEIGIQTSIHYPAFWNFTAYKDVYNEDETPIASIITQGEITLPLFPMMTIDQVDQVTTALIEACQ